MALVTRVKSLLRLKMVTDELELRADAMQSVGSTSPAAIDDSAEIAGRILVVDDRENSDPAHTAGAAASVRGRDHRRSRRGHRAGAEAVISTSS